MPKIAYKRMRISDDKRRMIDQANSIIRDYADQGYSLTLRQLYYQFVSRDLFPQSWVDPETGSTNNERSYKKLGGIMQMGECADLWIGQQSKTEHGNLCGNHHGTHRWISSKVPPSLTKLTCGVSRSITLRFGLKKTRWKAWSDKLQSGSG